MADQTVGHGNPGTICWIYLWYTFQKVSPLGLSEFFQFTHVLGCHMFVKNHLIIEIGRLQKLYPRFLLRARQSNDIQSCWILHCKLFSFICQCFVNRLLKSAAVLLTFYKKRGINPEFMIICHPIIWSGVIIFRRHIQQMIFQLLCWKNW